MTAISAPLRSWRVVIMGLAAANVLAGIAAERLGLFRALHLDALSVFFWGFCYALLAWIVAWRPKRALIAVVVWVIIDGARLTFLAGDVGEGIPLLAILLRIGLGLPVVKAALLAEQAAEDAAWRGRGPGIVARVHPRQPEPRSPTVRPGVELKDRQETMGEPPARAASPRVTGSILTTGTRTPAVSVRTPAAAVDSAATALRYVARRCEVRGDRLDIVASGGRSRSLAWAEFGEIWIRMLPPERPWESQLLLELIPKGAGVEPVRVFATTMLSWLGGAAPSTSRLANLRRLCQDIATRAPDLAMDDATRRFLEEGSAPQQLARVDSVVERDARYGCG
jgi:hypothetical protein